jgi:hypothetical protein
MALATDSRSRYFQMEPVHEKVAGGASSTATIVRKNTPLKSE